jgi:anti-anti-sigma regulatory factor
MEHLSDISRELAELRATIARTQERAGHLADAMVAIASGDYDQPVYVSHDNDLFDGLAVGLNTMREEMRAAIAQQAEIILEMSTPLVPISDEIVVMPLVGGIDDARAQRVIMALLEGVTRHRARAAILDITGVAVMNPHVAKMLLGAGAAAKLLGARVILTGIRPDIASALVSLGVDMSGVATSSSLQGGLMFAQRSLRGASR